MSSVNVIEKRVVLDRTDIVRFQWRTHFFTKKIHVKDSLIECLARLSLAGTVNLLVFCEEIAGTDLFGSTQTVRNCLGVAERLGLIIKVGKKKKTIRVNPEINIQTEGSILLDYKFMYKDVS